jgi:Flp pilus assembly protein TadG
MARRPTHPLHAQRGFSSANTVIWLPVIIMMTWLALEVALLYRWAYRAQAAADAAALAAAARYRDGRETASDDAVAAAGATRGPAGPITIDVGNGTSGGEDLEFGLWDEDTRTFTGDPVDGGEAVRVTVRFVPGHPNGAPTMILGGLFTPGGVSMTRRSTAVFVPPRHETSMLVTSPLGTTLALQGTSVLSSRGGVSLVTNSSDAATIASGARASVAVLRAAGALSEQSEDAVDGAVEPGATIPDDPFAAVSVPVIDGSAAAPIALDPSGDTSVAPGVHAGLAAAGGTIVLQPGLHQFVGPVSLQGPATLQLRDATIQLDAGVALAMGGSATVSGTPAAVVAGWEGVFLLSRGDLASWSFDGDSVVDVNGLLYAPGADIAVQGAAGLRPASSIVRTVTATDAATIVLNGEIEALENDPVPGRARLVR